MFEIIIWNGLECSLESDMSLKVINMETEKAGGFKLTFWPTDRARNHPSTQFFPCFCCLVTKHELSEHPNNFQRVFQTSIMHSNNLCNKRTWKPQSHLKSWASDSKKPYLRTKLHKSKLIKNKNKLIFHQFHIIKHKIYILMKTKQPI